MKPFNLMRSLWKKTLNASVLQLEGTGLSIPRGDLGTVREQVERTKPRWLAVGATLVLYSRGRNREKGRNVVTLSVSHLFSPFLLSLSGVDALWWRPSRHRTSCCKHTLLSTWCHSLRLLSFSLFSVSYFFCLLPPLPPPTPSFLSSQRSVHSKDSLF